MSADPPKPSAPHADADGMPAEIEALLRELLVGPRRVSVDPSTGRVVSSAATTPENPTLDRSKGRE